MTSELQPRRRPKWQPLAQMDPEPVRDEDVMEQYAEFTIRGGRFVVPDRVQHRRVSVRLMFETDHESAQA